MLYTCVYSLLLLLNVQLTFEIRLLNLTVPEYAFAGQSAILTCIFDTETDQLYSIKWYFNGVEFFTYIPNAAITLRYYPITDINVDLSNSSTGQRIHLINIGRKSEGYYKCEVSADHTFQTESMQSYMTVVVEAASNPMIKGQKSSYKVGDIVNVTCTAVETIPESDIIWYINDDIVAEHFLLRYNRSHVTLLFQVQYTHLLDGNIIIKCVSVITRGKLITTKEISKPVINGHKRSYQLGEKVEMQCSISDDRYHLKWVFLNQKICPFTLIQYPSERSIRIRFHLLPCHLSDSRTLNIGCQAIRVADRIINSSKFLCTHYSFFVILLLATLMSNE